MRRTFEYGRTHVFKPKGKHQVTIVRLHGLGDNVSSWSQILETLPLPNIKWICPTAPTRPIALFGGFPSTASFDVGNLYEDAPADVEGLNSSAAHVANLLSTEPDENKLGVGGFTMGAAIACCVYGKYANGDLYPALSSHYKLYEEVGQGVSATVYRHFAYHSTILLLHLVKTYFLLRLDNYFPFENILSQSIAPIVGIVPHMPAVSGYMGDASATWPLSSSGYPALTGLDDPHRRNDASAE